MACDGTSGCGCTCLCWCEVPQAYYPCGIYAAPRPILNTLAFHPLAPVSSGGTPFAFEPVRAYVDGGGLGPPGAPAGRSIIDWGPKRPTPPGPHFIGGRKDTFRRRGWDGDDFLSPPPLEALKHREPGPVLFAPTAKATGPREATLIRETAFQGPTYDVGDSSGAIQSLAGIPVTAPAVRPPDSYLGVQEPTPYSRAAIAPPQAGEFLQGAGLGPGAGIGSEGSDPFEDNGRSAPMDTTVAEDAFPAPEAADEPAAVEPGDAPLPGSAVALKAPDFAGHPGVALTQQEEQRAKREPPGLRTSGSEGGGGGSFRPSVGSRPSIRPGIGFSKGKTNPAFSAAVDATRRQLDAMRRYEEAAGQGKGGLVRKVTAEADLEAAEVDLEAAESDLKEADSRLDPDRSGTSNARLRAREEAERQFEREESKLVKMSSGSGDIAAARTAAASIRAAIVNRDRATGLSAAVASARQDDRVSTADGRVKDAKAGLKAATAAFFAADERARSEKDPEKRKELEQAAQDARKDIGKALEDIKTREAVAARTRREARSPKARAAYRKQKEVAKKAAKAARREAQAARKAARRARNAARYGPASAVAKAEADAAAAKAASDEAMRVAEEEAGKLLDPDVPLEEEPPAAPCVCDCDPPCPLYAHCTCQQVPAEGEGEDPDEAKGVKGKADLKGDTVAPPDSGFGPRNVEEALRIDEEVRLKKEKEAAESLLDDDISSAQPERIAKVPPPGPGEKAGDAGSKDGARSVELRPQDSEPQPPQTGADLRVVDTKVAEMSSAEPSPQPPEEPKPVRLASGLLEASDARIKEDAKKAVDAIDRERFKVEAEMESLATDLMMIVGRNEEWKSWVRSRLGMEVKEDFYSNWEKDALSKLEWRIRELRVAHDDLTDMIADTYGDMHAALGSRGEAREDRLQLLNKRSWQGPEEVTEDLKKDKTLLDERLPDRPFKPDSLTQDWLDTLNPRERTTFGGRNLKALRTDLNQVSRTIAKAAAAELALNLVLAVAGGPLARGLIAVASKAYRGLKAAGALVHAGTTGAKSLSAARSAASAARRARVAGEIAELSSLASRRGRRGVAGASGVVEDASKFARASVHGSPSSLAKLRAWWRLGAENDASWRSLSTTDKVYYEIGQKTLPVGEFARYAHLSPIKRGRQLVADFGWAKALWPQGGGYTLGAGSTLSTGPTPLVRWATPRSVIAGGTVGGGYLLWRYTRGASKKVTKGPSEKMTE